MNTTNTLILLANNLINVKPANKKNTANTQMVGTVLSNMLSYGFIPSKAALKSINAMDDAELYLFWLDLAPAIKELTGANRQMEKFVVYKNFPKEVLEKSKAEYWLSQIFMYWGAPNALFTQEEQPRAELFEKTKLKVLQLAKKDSLSSIYTSLVKNPARWSDNQDAFARALMAQSKDVLDLSQFGFKENGVVLIADSIKNKRGHQFEISTATDTLRLAAELSGADVSLRDVPRFKKFSRSERKLLCGILDKCKNITEDFGSRPEIWKRLLSRLHPGDFNYKRVQNAYHQLYTNNIDTFNRVVDSGVYSRTAVLDALKSRPGEFYRRLHAAFKKYGVYAVREFVTVIPKLNTVQLVRLRKYIDTINDRKTLMYPPKGNWTRVQVVTNEKKELTKDSKEVLFKAIDKELSKRMHAIFPEGVQLDSATKAIKLQTNDQKLADYGRGTTFDIPENIKFIRTASYWAHNTNGYGNSWFDNGWNFFDADWNEQGVCSWNSMVFTKRGEYRSYWHDANKAQKNAAAVFSGDPTNSKDLKGRACQMIDLYIDRLLDAGVRYAVWNILCYSGVKFSEAEDVLATLQLGEKPEEGKLYEPARAQMVFPLRDDKFASYVAYIDLVDRKVVYMDAPLKCNVSSASTNGQMLSEKMPAYIEYLNSLPSVHDLVSKAKKGTTPILFSDKDKKFKAKKAFVFRPENASNKYDNIKLTEITGE